MGGVYWGGALIRAGVLIRAFTVYFIPYTFHNRRTGWLISNLNAMKGEMGEELKSKYQ